MLDLRTVGVAVGIVGFACGIAGLLAPGIVRTLLVRFPRNRVLGCALTAAVMGWAFWLLYHATFLAGLPVLKKAILVVGPISYILVVIFLDELLAARSFGGLLLLVPQIILKATFPHHQSEWRLVLTTLAYLWVIGGIVLLLSPYYFRRAASLLVASDARCRVAGGVVGTSGLGLIVLAMTVY